MKALQTIFAITILSFFAVACSNDGDSEANKPVSLLTKFTHDSGYSNYTYDANNKLSLTEEVNPGFSNYKTTFVYNSNGKIEESLTVSTGGMFPSAPLKMTYTYDAQNRLIEKKYFQAPSQNSALFNYFRSDFFEYNGNLLTLKSFKKEDNFPDTRTIYEFDNNGNIIKKIAYSQMTANNPNGLIFYSETYIYDDKMNPETSLPSEYKFPNFTKNNQLKTTNVMSNETYITDFVYEYNTDGYVTKRSSSDFSSSAYEYKKL